MQKIRNLLILILLLFETTVKSQSNINNFDSTLWVNSFEKAKTIAMKKNFSVLLFFTGSDTCSNCIKMQKNILETQEFKDYSKTTFVLYHVDYPKSKSNKLSLAQLNKNKELVIKYNPGGKLPQIVVLDPKGGVKATANFLDIPVSEYLPQFKALLNMFK
ncbi:MAG: thioredoxin fold domain-containing protein [Bacteroidales bacterium]